MLYISFDIMRYLKFLKLLCYLGFVFGIVLFGVDMSAGLNQGQTVVGKAESDDMYAAIDGVLDKLERELQAFRHFEVDAASGQLRGSGIPVAGCDVLPPAIPRSPG